MTKLPQISDSEWHVMKVVWSRASCTANEVVEELSEKMNWQSKTIKTLINRLVNKNALGYAIDKQDKKTYHYFALVSESDSIKAESKWFLKRVFNGSPNMLLANFIKESKLSRQDIQELKRILDEKKDD